MLQNECCLPTNLIFIKFDRKSIPNLIKHDKSIIESSFFPSAYFKHFYNFCTLTSRSDVILYAALESPSFKSHTFDKSLLFCCLSIVVVLYFLFNSRGNSRGDLFPFSQYLLQKHHNEVSS